MVPSLPLLSCELSVSVKENPDRKKKKRTKKGRNQTSNVKTLQRRKEGLSCTKTRKCCKAEVTEIGHHRI